MATWGPSTSIKEDDTHTSGDAGTMALVVRKATPANLSDTDGDYEPLQVSAGRLWTSATIDAALPAGTNAIGKLAANSGIDIGDVDVTSIIPGTGATNLGKAEDSIHSSGDVGVYVLAVRDDSLAAHSGADGDYESLHTDAIGALWVAGSQTEDAAHTTGDRGVAILAVRQDTLSALAGTTGDYIPLSTDSSGRLYETTRPDNYAVDDSAMPATPNTMPVSGEYRSSATTYTDGDATVLQSDVNGNLKATLATQIAGEDLTNDVLKSEQRFSYSNVNIDTAVKSDAGFLHTITFSCNDAAPTAGTIDIYDALPILY